MIKQLFITNHLGESILLPLGNPSASGFSIRGIAGLGPPKANINLTQVLTLDGAYFNSARVGYRNIVVTIGFEFVPGESIEDLRLKSYRFFPVKKELQLVVETDNRIAVTSGRVESNEVAIFSKNETAVISILCPDAYFYSLQSLLTDFTQEYSSFEFPFSNESLTESVLEFGTVAIDLEKNILYNGDAETGVFITIRAVGTVEDFEIFNMSTGESMFIDTTKLETFSGDPIIAGDVITISTVKGNKYISLLRDGTTYNIMNALGPDSSWFQLSIGDNLFTYTATSGLYNIFVSIQNNILYEGV